LDAASSASSAGGNPNVSGTILRAGAILELADHRVSSVSAGILVKVLSGGVQEVHSGTASGAIVESGGTQDIFSGGTAVNTKVHSAGLQDVESSGTAIGATVSGDFAFQYVFLPERPSIRRSAAAAGNISLA
jgi:autotransporter passenger strand-loop-strand repeat protein